MTNQIVHEGASFSIARRRGSGVAMLAMALLLVLSAWAPAVHAQRVDPLADLDRDQRRVFQNYTRLFCAQFFRYGEDRFVILPNHYTKRENSSGRTYSQLKEELTITKREKVGFLYKDVKYPPEEAEVIAGAMMLPNMDVGHYGHINKVKIREIIGTDEMIVTGIELIPRDKVGRQKNAIRKNLLQVQQAYENKTYRLLGFRTRGLRAGQDYMGPKNKGLHIAVMSTDQQHAFVLVNFDELKRVRTSEFHEVLGYVKMSPPAFLDMVRDNRERLLSKGDTTSLISIYQRFYNRYRPKRVSVAPPTVQPKPDPPASNTDTTKPETPKPEPADEKPDTNEGRDYDRTIDTDVPQEEFKPGTPNNDNKPEPKPEPVEEEEPEDDWDPEKDSSTGDPGFFGIPLGL